MHSSTDINVICVRVYVCVLTVFIYFLFLFFLNVWVLLPFDGEIKMYILERLSKYSAKRKGERTEHEHEQQFESQRTIIMSNSLGTNRFINLENNT